MSSVQSWAEAEVEGADFGDRRLNRRASAMLIQMEASPGGRVTSVFESSSEQEGAFRFLRNETVCAAELSRSSFEGALSRLGDGEDYVVAIDQTSLAVTDRQRSKGMGRIGSESDEAVSGFQVMSGLVVGTDQAVKGLCTQQWWKRASDCPSWSQDTRQFDERESILWRRALEEAEESRQSAGVTGRPWYQLDRGADSWHLWENIQNENLQVTIRSAYNRKLTSGEGRLHDDVAASKVRGGIRLQLDPSNARRAGHRVRRARRLVVRYKKVVVSFRRSRPQKGSFEADLSVVHVREARPPKNAERIEWFLLTTHAIGSLADALDVIENYRLRWRVEEFHKTWKTSACDIESSQLRSAETFRRWATLQAMVASRIEQMKRVSRASPDASAEEVATRHEIDTLIILAHKKKLLPAKRLRWQPGDFMSAKDFVDLVATMGGYTGKSSGGPPGSITIRRGLERLLPAVDALEATGIFEKL